MVSGTQYKKEKYNLISLQMILLLLKIKRLFLSLLTIFGIEEIIIVIILSLLRAKIK
jgi:hypothetical protein